MAFGVLAFGLLASWLLASWLPGLLASWLFGFWLLRVLGFWLLWLFGFSLPRFKLSLMFTVASWLFGFCLCSFVAVDFFCWCRGCLASWFPTNIHDLSSFPTSWLGCLPPNPPAFITPTFKVPGPESSPFKTSYRCFSSRGPCPANKLLHTYPPPYICFHLPSSTLICFHHFSTFLSVHLIRFFYHHFSKIFAILFSFLLASFISPTTLQNIISSISSPHPFQKNKFCKIYWKNICHQKNIRTV